MHIVGCFLQKWILELFTLDAGFETNGLLTRLQVISTVGAQGRVALNAASAFGANGPRLFGQANFI